MRDVVETTHIFFKLMEKFCNGSVVVQDKRKSRAKSKKAKKPQKSSSQHGKTPDDDDNNEEVSRFILKKKHYVDVLCKVDIRFSSYSSSSLSLCLMHKMQNAFWSDEYIW